ncbi:MAG: YceI family protein [Gemmatimonadota bacterium]|nr:YceI family protein [Gemmatimonadota bacterium]
MLNVPWTLAAVSMITLTSSIAVAPRTPNDAPLSLLGGPPDTLVVQPSSSRIHWKGSALRGSGKHEGDVRFVSGMIIIRHQKLTGGNFTVDMGGVDSRFPNAVFTASDAKRTGDATWEISGNLNMLGVNRPLTFSTEVKWGEVGHMTATSSVLLDQPGWGVAFRDAKLARDPAEGDVAVSITLDARRKGSTVATR